MSDVERVPIRDIRVGDRTRAEYRHIEQLAESLRRIGMLNPVTVTTDLRLIAGGRRLKAAERCGWDDVPVVRVAALDEALLALVAERDENTCREPLSPSESVALGKRIEAIEGPAAKERQESTRSKPGQKVGKGGAKLAPPKNKGKTRDKVAEAVGMGRTTYDKAKQVSEAAEQQPELFGDLKEKMDAESVDAAHKELKKRQDAPPPPDPTKPHPLDVPELTGVYTPRVMTTRPGHQVVLDAYDNPTPPGVGDCFADPALRERFMAITAAAEVLEDEYKHLIKDKSGHDPAKQFPWVEIPALQDHVTTARNALVAAADLIRAGFPHGVCPKCWGEKCKECRLSGFWPRPVCEKHAALFQKRKGA
jgi:ParB-like chromosome segregation protein Spo0J